MGVSENAEKGDDLLRREAEEIKSALAKIARANENAHARRTASMKKMREAGRSWAEIGRIYGVTPQAAMYATGAATRTPRRQQGQ